MRALILGVHVEDGVADTDGVEVEDTGGGECAGAPKEGGVLGAETVAVADALTAGAVVRA